MALCYTELSQFFHNLFTEPGLGLEWFALVHTYSELSLIASTVVINLNSKMKRNLRKVV